MKLGSKKGVFGTWYPIINDKIHICSHIHRTYGGAERCGISHVRFLKKVEAFKQSQLDINNIVK